MLVGGRPQPPPRAASEGDDPMFGGGGGSEGAPAHRPSEQRGGLLLGIADEGGGCNFRS